MLRFVCFSVPNSVGGVSFGREVLQPDWVSNTIQLQTWLIPSLLTLSLYFITKNQCNPMEISVQSMLEDMIKFV